MQKKKKKKKAANKYSAITAHMHPSHATPCKFCEGRPEFKSVDDIVSSLGKHGSMIYLGVI